MNVTRTSPCWWIFLRFPLVHQEISSGFLICLIILQTDLISFPNLFDQLITKKTCFPPICSFCCLIHQLSQVFPNYFSTGACYHWVSSVFPTDFLSSPWCFISFGCPFLHCIIKFHQPSSPKSSLYHSFSSVFSHLLVIFYH